MLNKTPLIPMWAFRIFFKTLFVLLLSVIFFLPLKTHASEKTLAVFPLVMYADQSKSFLRQGVRSMLISRLAGGGIEIISDKDIEPLLTEKEKEGIASKKRAKELAGKLQADFAVFGSITTLGAGCSLDLSLLVLIGDRPRLKRVSEAVDEDRLIPRLADIAYKLRAIIEGKETSTRKIAAPSTVLPREESVKGLFSRVGGEKRTPAGTEKGLFFEPTRESWGFKPTGRISLKMSVMAFDTGDLDGDGEGELVILGRKKLLLFKGEGGSFVFKNSLKPSIGEEFLKVTIGDINKNGRPEIYLVSLYGQRARTSVYEWTGSFKKLYSKSGHMQVIRGPGKGRSLLFFQDSKLEEFFSGRIFIMGYEKGKPTKVESLPKLKGAQFYTMALFDVDKDGNAEYLGLGKGSTLHVWDKTGKVLWKGDKQLGGTNNAIMLGDTTPGDLPPSISINSRIVITDIDGDGKKEILAVENIPLVEHVLNLMVYIESKLIAYRIEGLNLLPAWTTRKIKYCMTDIQSDGRTIFLAAQKGKIENISRGSSRIMWFD